MNILEDKSLKAKEKAKKLFESLQNKEISPAELISLVSSMKESEVVIVMEAFEYLTKDKSGHGSQEIFDFAVKYIEASTPGLRRESGRVAGNTVTFSMRNIDKAVSRLLVNTEDPGTVVRWSAAYALAEIFKLSIPELPNLRDTLERICQREEKDSIKKIYANVLKRY